MIRLVRGRPRGPEEVQWDPERALDPATVSGFDAVVHLSGASIFGRWTDKKKDEIRRSRVTSTRNLAQALAKAQRKPRVFLVGSAIGYYGNRGEEILREGSASGSGFLPEVCREWEAASQAAAEAGIRVAHSRTGIVLSGAGGALAQMLTPFRLGVGGKLGSGKQWMSWIHIDDMIGALEFVLGNEGMRGAVNAVSPNPARNAEFTRTLGKTLSRPTILPAPAFALRLIFGGEMADETLLASQRVESSELGRHGYRFRYPELDSALTNLLPR